MRLSIILIMVLSMAMVTVWEVQAKGSDPLRIASGFSAPVGMAFDSKNNLYVANWSSGDIVRINDKGQLTKVITGVAAPSGIAISRNDTIYIASYEEGKIYKAKLSNTQLPLSVSLFCSGFSVPAGINLDSKGDLLVADRGRGQIIKISSSCKKEVVVDNLKTPVGIVELHNTLVIATLYGTVTAYDLTEKTLRTLTRKLRSPAVGLVVDPTYPGSVLAVDYGRSHLYRIGLDGKSETINSDLPTPVGLAVSKDNWAFVATWGDNSLYKIELKAIGL